MAETSVGVLDSDLVINQEDRLMGLWASAAAASTSLDFLRGPGAPLIQFGRFLNLAERSEIKLDLHRGLDFGCGTTRPYSIATLMYLFGVEEVVAIDLAGYQPYEAPAIAKGLWLLLAVMYFGNSGLEKSSLYNQKLVRARLADFNLDALRNGQLQDGMPGSIQHRVGDYLELAPQIGRLDIVISNSVFEHVPNLRGTMEKFRVNLQDGGSIYSDIDYRDHRMYLNGLSPWQYLMDDSDVSLGYINKIRYSAMNSLLENSGFRIDASNRVLSELPDNVRAALHPNYRNLSEADLTIVQDSVLLR